MGYLEEAVQVALRLASMNITGASTQDSLGVLLTLCDEPQLALRYFSRAVRQCPDSCGYLYNLATVQRMLGEIDAAEKTLTRVLVTNPKDVAAYQMLADLKTQTSEANHIKQLEALGASPQLKPMDEVAVRFTLAKELEDIECYAESFEHLQKGCSLFRGMIKYNVEDDIKTIDRLIQIHRGPALACNSGCPADEPVFVIGLPRTGTTLVDRILNAHSRLSSIGESMAFPLACNRVVQRRLHPVPSKIAFVDHSLDTDPIAIGIGYLSSLKAARRSGPHSQGGRIVDKQPMNMLYAGLIRRSLPRARFIIVSRDPMDACYAMYKTLFANAHPYSYDLQELAKYYAAWRRLARHWQETLGDRLLLVEYEDLVAHPRDVAARMLAHCRLSWEDTCLEFHRQRDPVMTASAVQVRQPIYQSSVGKWRRYRNQLRPLSSTLERLLPGADMRVR